MTAVFAVPMMLMITSGDTVALTVAMVVGLNIGVLGVFSAESAMLPEPFGSRTRFTPLAVAKEIGGVLGTAVGPVLAASLTAATKQWWPVAAMLIAYSLITFVAAYLSPETRGRDLVRREDVA
jgi:MHS family metabolite:H+ symporter-like MFS transporter